MEHVLCLTACVSPLCITCGSTLSVPPRVIRKVTQRLTQPVGKMHQSTSFQNHNQSTSKLPRGPILDLNSVRPQFLPQGYEPSKDRKSAFELREAPVFKPTSFEFQDPLAYIASISEIGEEFGLLKIIPPDGWKPNFSIDTEVLHCFFIAGFSCRSLGGRGHLDTAPSTLTPN